MKVTECKSGVLINLQSYRKRALFSPSILPTLSTRNSRACALGEQVNRLPVREDNRNHIKWLAERDYLILISTPFQGHQKGIPTHQANLSRLGVDRKTTPRNPQHFNFYIQEVICISYFQLQGTGAIDRPQFSKDKALNRHLGCVSVSILAISVPAEQGFLT